MEAWDGWGRDIGSTDNSKFLVIKQDLVTKLNVSMFYQNSKIELRNFLDLNKTQYDFLMKHQYIDVEDHRYCIMLAPYWMSK